jgi:hypothetical protein
MRMIVSDGNHCVTAIKIEIFFSFIIPKERSLGFYRVYVE